MQWRSAPRWICLYCGEPLTESMFVGNTYTCVRDGWIDVKTRVRLKGTDIGSEQYPATPLVTGLSLDVMKIAQDARWADQDG